MRFSTTMTFNTTRRNTMNTTTIATTKTGASRATRRPRPPGLPGQNNQKTTLANLGHPGHHVQNVSPDVLAAGGIHRRDHCLRPTAGRIQDVDQNTPPTCTGGFMACATCPHQCTDGIADHGVRYLPCTGWIHRLGQHASPM